MPDGTPTIGYRHGRLLAALGIVGLLYVFLLSIDLMGASFKLFGENFAQQIISFTNNPLRGLFIGILATSIVQSSSTTTSMVVTMVAGGALNVEHAIPIIMGANVGTSVTNTIVSLAHISRTREFQRAFAASTVHDLFNLLSVIILFPLQYYTNFLGFLATGLGEMFMGSGTVEFKSPIKLATGPVRDAIKWMCQEQAWIVLVVGVVLLFVALKYLVKLLRIVVLERSEGFFERHVFKTAIRAFVVGILLTVMVQSSSITTSIVIPLAGAGILSLKRIYPYTLGANVGTTVTAILASLVSLRLEPLIVAFSHLLFNICGIAIITPFRPLREVPLRVAKWLGRTAMRRRWVPLLYVLVIFFVIPLLILLFGR